MPQAATPGALSADLETGLYQTPGKALIVILAPDREDARRLQCGTHPGNGPTAVERVANRIGSEVGTLVEVEKDRIKPLRRLGLSGQGDPLCDIDNVGGHAWII